MNPKGKNYNFDDIKISIYGKEYDFASMKYDVDFGRCPSVGVNILELKFELTPEEVNQIQESMTPIPEMVTIEYPDTWDEAFAETCTLSMFGDYLTHLKSLGWVIKLGDTDL